METDYGVTYADYVKTYRQADEESFVRLLLLAVSKLNLYTCNRALSLPADSYKLAQVRNALCALVDHLAVQEQTQQGYGIQSVGNEGYSESYQAATPEKADANLRSVCLTALSGTGLMGAL